MEMKLVNTTLNGLKFWYRRDDRFIGQRIALGKYETYETKVMLNQTKNDDVVADVGANIGYYTLLIAQKAKRVYAVEPDPDNFEILKKNVRENNLKNVVLIKAAAGNRNEQRLMIKDKNNFGNHRLTDSRIKIYDSRIEHVKCRRLDDILINEQKINLIKSDTQGWEPAVLQGAEKIIQRDSPTLFLEYWPEGVSETKYDLRSMMYELKKIYKNIWEIDEELGIYKRIKDEIAVNPTTGYADIWLKKKATLSDHLNQYRNVRIRKLVKKAIMILYGKN